MQYEVSLDTRQDLYKSGRAQYDESIKHFEKGDIVSGRISISLALTIFKKIDHHL